MTERDLLTMSPVRAYLIPAARSFLRARQYCPFRPITQFELATLDGLLQGADPSPVLIERLVRGCGPNSAPLGGPRSWPARSATPTSWRGSSGSSSTSSTRTGSRWPTWPP